jgi:Arginine and glutamate-rich 1
VASNDVCPFQMVEEETQKRIELLIKKRVDSILESRKQQIEDEINKRVSNIYPLRS